MSKTCRIDISLYGHPGIRVLVSEVLKTCPPINKPEVVQLFGDRLDPYGTINWDDRSFRDAEEMAAALTSAAEESCGAYLGLVGHLEAMVYVCNRATNSHVRTEFPGIDIRLSFPDAKLDFDEETRIANPVPYFAAARGCFLHWAGLIERVTWCHG